MMMMFLISGLGLIHSFLNNVLDGVYSTIPVRAEYHY
jgi:hypothetical protein